MSKLLDAAIGKEGEDAESRSLPLYSSYLVFVGVYLRNNSRRLRTNKPAVRAVAQPSNTDRWKYLADSFGVVRHRPLRLGTTPAARNRTYNCASDNRDSAEGGNR